MTGSSTVPGRGPLVSCQCLTTERRRAWLPKAIESFLGQTYERKQLLIVFDGPGTVADLVPADPRIRLFVSGFRLNVGEKRNVACEAAEGADFVAHFDDDDWSEPDRLAHQIARLEETGKAVAGFYAMKFTDGARWWQYSGSRSGCCGTSLCYRREWWSRNKFASMNCGQDESFSAQAASKKVLEAEGDLELMYATVHPGNTSPRSIGGANYKLLPGFEWKGVAA